MDFSEIASVLIIVVLWLVRLFAGGKKRRQPQQAGEPEPQRAEQRRAQEQQRKAQAQQSAIDLLRELGLDLEEKAVPPPPAPAQAPRAPVPPPPPAIPPSERRTRAGVPPSRAPGRRSVSEGAPPAATPRGGGQLQPMPSISSVAVPPAAPDLGSSLHKPSDGETRLQASRLRSRVLQDLRGGASSLARAIVLREVLGPPPGLRPPGSGPER